MGNRMQTELVIDPEMSAITPPDNADGDIQVQLREIRLVGERLLMVLGVPDGSWRAAREFLVDACAVTGLEALEALEAQTRRLQSDAVSAPTWTAPTPSDQSGPGELHLDAYGQSALLVGHVISNAAAGWYARAQRHGVSETRVVVAKLADAGLIRALEPRLSLLGINVELIELHADTATLRLTSSQTRTEPTAPYPPHLHKLINHGMTVEAALWWRLYYPSNLALSADTEISRYHTGDTLRRVTDDGPIYIRAHDPLNKTLKESAIYVDVH